MRLQHTAERQQPMIVIFSPPTWYPSYLANYVSHHHRLRPPLQQMPPDKGEPLEHKRIFVALIRTKDFAFLQTNNSVTILPQTQYQPLSFSSRFPKAAWPEA